MLAVRGVDMDAYIPCCPTYPPYPHLVLFAIRYSLCRPGLTE